MLEFFDLQALVARNPSDPEIAALKPLIHAVVSLHSVGNDLKRAAEMMAACKALSSQVKAANDRGEGPRRDQAATVQALFAQSVLVYTRATHSGGKGRNKLQITNHLDPEWRVLHDRMTAHRDRYLAHFEDAKGWEEHRAVLALDVEEGKMALSYPHASAYIQVEQAVDLENLLNHAIPIAQAQSDKVSLKLNLALNARFGREVDFVDRLRGVPFEPAEFFEVDEIQPYLDSVGSHERDAPTDARIGGMRAVARPDVEGDA